MIVLFLYFILINLAGFFAMGLDKKRARRRQYRTPERTLFLIALAGGSLGIFLGMYHFRHKTRHWSFRLGIPAILLLQLLLAVLAWFLFR